ncbi:DUF4232 domain-containing protein [Streptomyces sp. NPDC002643]
MIPTTGRGWSRAMPVAVLAMTVTGCGLSAEIERERDPARAESFASATPTGTPAAGTWPSDLPDVSVSDLDLPYGDVPTDSSAATACPGSGARIRPEPVEAAMGLRAMRVTLTNCGTGTYTLDGYPELQLLDSDSEPVDVRVLKGTEQITTGVPDPGPVPVTLKSGESAKTVLAWRNTVTEGNTPAVDAPYLKVTPAEGRPSEIVTPDGGIDLGNTGRLGVTAWEKVSGQG